MPRIACKIEYFGKNFCGSQKQEGVRTVQSACEDTLGVFFRTGTRRLVVTFAGRTDSGVHAAGQVIHFDLKEDDLRSGKLEPDESGGLSAFEIQRMLWGLNGIAGQDLSFVRAQVVPQEFHARRSACRRTYVYRILNRPQRSAFTHDNHYFVSEPLELESMKTAAQALSGTHDFSAFRSSNADNSTVVCNVEDARILNLGEGKLEFWISANHFVYNMVRIIVGTLVETGLGKRSPSSIEEALIQKRRDLAGPTAPPWGLTLAQVEYPSEFNLFQEDCFSKVIL